MRLPYSVLLLYLCLCLSSLLSAQAPSASDSQSTDDNKSWSATVDQQAPSGAGFSPTRTSESHTHANGRTVDKQTVELRGSDGTYQPLRDIERESIRVDAGTTRTVERVYGRGPDGQRTLIQVREEESRSLPGGDQKVTRTTSNPDANGSLQVIQRELQETRKSGPDMENTKTTVLMPDLNGGFSPISQSEETNTRKAPNRVEFHKTTSVPDGNGGWQLQEVREGSINDEADKSHTREERVLRPGSDGNLTLTQRTVTKETQNAPGETRQTVENYSADLPGTANDGTLHLNKRITTVHRSRADGARISEEQVEQRDPAAPGEPQRMTQKTIDIIRPGMGNTSTQTRTVQALDANGDLSTVWVDTGKTETAPSVQVDTRQANAPASVTVDTKSPPKPQ